MAGKPGIPLGLYYDDETEKAGEPHTYSGERHLIVFGPNGSGKGTRFLIPSLLTISDRSVIAIDPKGSCARSRKNSAARSARS